MAKPTGISGRKSKFSQGKKPAAKLLASPAHDRNDEVDGCDFEFDDSDATSDAALPAARGGVETKSGRRR